MIQIDDKHPTWRAAYHAGTLHVFEMRFVCPCCSEVWYQDVLDVPEQFEIPDRRKLGLALLCGSCEARRVTLFVVPGKDGWSAPFLSRGEISTAWGRLNAPQKGTWVKAEGKGPYVPGGKMRDDRKALFVACTTRERDGRRVNIGSMTAEALSASGLDWKQPPPSIGNNNAATW